jgi:flagellar motor component MotA
MKYKVIWEVSKYAIIKAKSKEEAIKKVMEEEIESFEEEITMPPEAYIIK